MPQISPQIAIYLNILYAMLTSITAPALQAAGVANAEQVVAIAALIAAPLNVLLHAISAPTQGPLVPPANGGK